MAVTDPSEAAVATQPQNVPRPTQPQPDLPTSSTPLEMSSLPSNSHMHEGQPTAEQQISNSMEPGRAQSQYDDPPAAREGASKSTAEPSISPAVSSPPTSLTQLQSTAIGPSSDDPIPIPKMVEETGPILMITLLLIDGARHPFKLDAKYLNKRSVEVQGNDPFNLSVYKLKELILREWREGSSNTMIKIMDVQTDKEL